MQPLSGFFAPRATWSLVLLLLATPAAGQEADKFQTWTKVEEARETRDYKEGLRGGGPLDDAARSFLTQIALPQLETPANRPTIERVRRRIRELLLTDIANNESHDAANRVVLEFMERRARDPAAEPPVRVNAMLLIGELKDKDGRPWPAAVTRLAAAAGDATLPMEVRISGLAGLSKHVDGAARKSGKADALPKTAADVVKTILIEQPKDSNQAAGRWRVESDWMASRAASMLPAFTTSASKDMAAALVTVLEDERRSINTRVRAAAALGATVGAASEINVAQAVESIRALAILAVEGDLAAVDRQRLEESGAEVAGAVVTASAGGLPGNASRPGVPESVCRRAAWRLATLADAVLAENGESGLALLAGDTRETTEKMALSLRAAANAIDAAPGEKSLTAALATMGRQPAVPPTPAPVQPKPAQPKPAEPAPSPFDNPFGT